MQYEPKNQENSWSIPLHESEYEAIRRFLYDQSGIALGDSKRDLVRSRLAKRLRLLRLSSFADYLHVVQHDDSIGGERQEFINCLTTNKTDFFRESHHFDYLRDVIVPRLASVRHKRLRVWCAASSTGEEPYSIAMTLAECCPHDEGWDVKILATDIDTQVLKIADQAIYSLDRLSGVSPSLLRKYFFRGTGRNESNVAVRPELRSLLTFRQFNLIAESWPFKSQFDVIFCRNVVIYFDRPTQHRLMERFSSLLHPEGYLILGHSENLHWMSERFSSLGNTVYRLNSSCHSHDLSPSVGPPQEYSIVLGDVKTAKGPAVLKTLLGSCVSACIYDPVSHIGGMNHFSLPGENDTGVSARYGAHAMDLLISAVMKLGGDRSRLRAKVFGGAKVLNVDSQALNVGSRNADFVLRYLQTEGIPVDGQCLGGTRGLLVRFHPDTGRAQAKPLSDTDSSVVARDESSYARALQKRVEVPDDNITLF